MSVFGGVALCVFGFAFYARNFAALMRMLNRQEAGDQAPLEGRPQEAILEYRRGLSIGDKLTGRDARDVRYREVLPGLHARMGLVLSRRGDDAGARAECQRAADLLRAMPALPADRSPEKIDKKGAPALQFCQTLLR